MKENLLLSSAEYERIIVKMLHDTLTQLCNISNRKLHKQTRTHMHKYVFLHAKSCKTRLHQTSKENALH